MPATLKLAPRPALNEHSRLTTKGGWSQEGRVIVVQALPAGLTPAEARLAARFGVGETLEEAADALSVSLGTARNQLKAIFSKTETNRQAELVALLWRVSDLAVSSSIQLP